MGVRTGNTTLSRYRIGNQIVGGMAIGNEIIYRSGLPVPTILNVILDSFGLDTFWFTWNDVDAENYFWSVVLSNTIVANGQTKLLTSGRRVNLADNTIYDLNVFARHIIGERGTSYGNLGSLPSGLDNPEGVAIDSNGDAIVVDAAGNDIWRIDLNNLSSISSPYGNLGKLPSNLTVPRGLTIDSNGDAIVVDNSGDEVWRIDLNNPSSTSSPYGNLGRLPSGLTNPQGVAIDSNGDVIVIDNTGDEVWRIDLSNPSSTAGIYGKLGDLPSGLTIPTGVAIDSNGDAIVVDYDGDNIWRIDLSNPSSTSSSSPYRNLGSLPSGLTTPTGVTIDSHGDAIVVDNTGDDIWRIDLSNPSSTVSTSVTLESSRTSTRRFETPKRLDQIPTDDITISNIITFEDDSIIPIVRARVTLDWPDTINATGYNYITLQGFSDDDITHSSITTSQVTLDNLDLNTTFDYVFIPTANDYWADATIFRFNTNTTIIPTPTGLTINIVGHNIVGSWNTVNITNVVYEWRIIKNSDSTTADNGNTTGLSTGSITLEDNTGYTFYLKATVPNNAVFLDSSEISQSFNTNSGDPLDTPVIIKGLVTTTTAEFSWTAITDANNYVWTLLSSNGGVLSSGSTTSTSVTVSGLSASNGYTFRLVAEKTTLPIRTSLPALLFFGSQLAEPVISVGRVTENSASLSWSEDNDADVYNFYYSRAGTAGSNIIETGITSTNKRTIKNLLEGYLHVFGASAHDNNGFYPDSSYGINIFTTLCSAPCFRSSGGLGCSFSCDTDNCMACNQIINACVNTCTGDCKSCDGKGKCTDTQTPCKSNTCQIPDGSCGCKNACNSCETCTNGSCVSRCNSSNCETCISGRCVSECSSSFCQICSNGSCISRCNANSCQACSNGSCVNKCSSSRCETCRNGSCVSRCTSSETCRNGSCVSGCTGCDVYRNGRCVSSCGICQTCSGSTCTGGPPTCTGCQTLSGCVCTGGCSSSRCETCVFDTCMSTCTGCDTCSGGRCVSTCTGCDTCSGTKCVSSCSSDNCETCRGGKCVSTCTGCAICFLGSCVNSCTGCDTCRGGRCVSTCTGCDTCRGGRCVSSCGECQTCSGSTCTGGPPTCTGCFRRSGCSCVDNCPGISVCIGTICF